MLVCLANTLYDADSDFANCREQYHACQSQPPPTTTPPLRYIYLTTGHDGTVPAQLELLPRPYRAAWVTCSYVAHRPCCIAQRARFVARTNALSPVGAD